jgi:hypothetical protein
MENKNVVPAKGIGVFDTRGRDGKVTQAENE